MAQTQEICISYSQKDRQFVRRLNQALQAGGRNAWVDREDIRPTEEFMQAIVRAIQGADPFVFIPQRRNKNSRGENAVFGSPNSRENWGGLTSTI